MPSLHQRPWLLPHNGQNISFSNSPHTCKNFMYFSWSKHKNQKTVWSQTIRPHYTTPQRSPLDKRKDFSFVLVSLDYRGERKRHVIVTKVLLQFWKAYNIKMNAKLLQLHVLKLFSHASVEDDQNQWNYLNTFAMNSTVKHTHTAQRKAVNAAIGCGFHSLVVMVLNTTYTFQQNEC